MGKIPYKKWVFDNYPKKGVWVQGKRSIFAHSTVSLS